MRRLPKHKNIAADSSFKPDGEETGELIGYARVSTAEQSLNLQVDALRKAGIGDNHIYREYVSGVAQKRPMRDGALRDLRPGDTLVVWKLDRLGRSMYELVKIWHDLEVRGIKFRSLTEGIDTTTSGGRMLMHVLGALAQFERDQIRERTAAGIRARLRRNAKWGPKVKLTAAQVKRGKQLRAQGKSRREVADTLGVSEYTVHYYIISDKPRKPRQ